MKKNGFTIAELLVTLGLIAIMGLIIVNNVVALSNRQDEKEYEEFKSRVEKAACVYAGLDENNAECGNKTCIVSVGTLISEGLIEDYVVNPKTQTEVDTSVNVYVKYENGKRTCYYSEDNGSYDFIGPSVTITKQYGMVKITFSDTSYLGKYEINTSPTNMNNPTNFAANKKSATVYYEPKYAGTYYVHAVDQFGNQAIISSANPTHPTFTVAAADIDTTKPVITLDSVSRGVIKATLQDDLKLKGYTITKSTSEPSSYTMFYNKVLTTADIPSGGDTKEITSDPYTTAATYYLHAVDYYNNRTYLKIVVEFTVPTITYTVSGRNVTLTFKDNVGLQKYFITKLSTLPDDAEWIDISDKVKEYTFTESFSSTGNWYVYLYDSQDNLTVKNILVS
ncbi:MAG: hypothetical protein J5892_00385 [Bacilli bacterium]|nr:hypothetical protein [Bacilli bacterium]